jgi:hypothetical protein
MQAAARRGTPTLAGPLGGRGARQACGGRARRTGRRVSGGVTRVTLRSTWRSRGHAWAPPPHGSRRLNARKSITANAQRTARASKRGRRAPARPAPRRARSHLLGLPPRVGPPRRRRRAGRRRGERRTPGPAASAPTSRALARGPAAGRGAGVGRGAARSCRLLARAHGRGAAALRARPSPPDTRDSPQGPPGAERGPGAASAPDHGERHWGKGKAQDSG